MKIFGMGVPELLIILAVILLIFGPKNLPKLGSAIGKTVKNLRDGMGAGKKEAKEAKDSKDISSDVKASESDETGEVIEEIVVEDENDVSPKETSESNTSGSGEPKKVRKVVVKKA